VPISGYDGSDIGPLRPARYIAAYSPEARGRSERAFDTHQGRLPRELARAGITDMAAANDYLDTVYRPHHRRALGSGLYFILRHCPPARQARGDHETSRLNLRAAALVPEICSWPACDNPSYPPEA